MRVLSAGAERVKIFITSVGITVEMRTSTFVWRFPPTAAAPKPLEWETVLSLNRACTILAIKERRHWTVTVFGERQSTSWGQAYGIHALGRATIDLDGILQRRYGALYAALGQLLAEGRQDGQETA